MDCLKKMIKICGAPKPVRLDGAIGQNGTVKEPNKSDVIKAIERKHENVESVAQFVRQKLVSLTSSTN